MPKELADLLADNKNAREVWEKLAPSHKREYVLWIEGAKKAETRAKRAAKSVEMMLKKHSA